MDIGLSQYDLHQSMGKTVTWLLQNESPILFLKSFESVSANKIERSCCSYELNTLIYISIWEPTGVKPVNIRYE